MKIDSINLSIFELPSNTGQFDLVEARYSAPRAVPLDWTKHRTPLQLS